MSEEDKSGGVFLPRFELIIVADDTRIIGCQLSHLYKKPDAQQKKFPRN